MTPLQKHFERLAAGFVTAIERGWMSREECQVLLAGAAFRGKSCAGLTAEQRDDLATWACIALDDAIMRPGLAAQQDIRVNLAPLLGRPRAELIITAYRAANGRLNAAEVEAVVSEEIAAFLARRSSGVKGLRHAG